MDIADFVQRRENQNAVRRITDRPETRAARRKFRIKIVAGRNPGQRLNRSQRIIDQNTREISHLRLR